LIAGRSDLDTAGCGIKATYSVNHAVGIGELVLVSPVSGDAVTGVGDRVCAGGTEQTPFIGLGIGLLLLGEQYIDVLLLVQLK
jgi:hypothetical protein